MEKIKRELKDMVMVYLLVTGSVFAAFIFKQCFCLDGFVKRAPVVEGLAVSRN